MVIYLINPFSGCRIRSVRNVSTIHYFLLSAKFHANLHWNLHPNLDSDLNRKLNTFNNGNVPFGTIFFLATLIFVSSYRCLTPCVLGSTHPSFSSARGSPDVHSGCIRKYPSRGSRTIDRSPLALRPPVRLSRVPTIAPCNSIRYRELKL